MGILNTKWNETLKIPPSEGKAHFLIYLKCKRSLLQTNHLKKDWSKEMILKVNQNRMILAPIIRDIRA